MGDCHDNAIKTAVSQGLKRCAVNLGDQFGLGLYNGGGVDAVVVRTVVDPLLAEPADTATPMAVEDAPVRPEPGSAQEHDEASVCPTGSRASPDADRARCSGLGTACRPHRRGYPQGRRQAPPGTPGHRRRTGRQRARRRRVAVRFDGPPGAGSRPSDPVGRRGRPGQPAP
ncbi:Rad52/Rad22 family DNA repair protein [Salinispora arenicola]|uniref:Rad52/Rad22 family DNA repair protein n=1 Tax=Salinispora arenicola TaxID=168697 RepID=UPI003467C965